MGPQGTHNEGTGRAEGKGPAGVEVGGVEGDQDADEVETLCLGEAEKSGGRASHPEFLGSQRLLPPIPSGEQG